MNKQRPIIFSAPMIRAILNNQKSQTRRLVTNQHLKDFQLERAPQKNIQSSPYGKIGDGLWVKETWRVPKEFDDFRPSEVPIGALIEYRSDGKGVDVVAHGKWRTPLFMSRHFSRATIKITDLRIEYLTDCSEDDAKAEGMVDILSNNQVSSKRLYKNAWESLHGVGSWESNPLVWVISFEIQKD